MIFLRVLWATSSGMYTVRSGSFLVFTIFTIQKSSNKEAKSGVRSCHNIRTYVCHAKKSPNHRKHHPKKKYTRTPQEDDKEDDARHAARRSLTPAGAPSARNHSTSSRPLPATREPPATAAGGRREPGKEHQGEEQRRSWRVDKDRDARRSDDQTRAVPQEVLYRRNLQDFSSSARKSSRRVSVKDSDTPRRLRWHLSTGAGSALDHRRDDIS